MKRNLKRRLLAAALSLALAASLCACGGTPAEENTSTPATAESPSGEKVYHLGMSIDTTSQAWRAGLADNVETAAAQYDNVELTITDAGGSVEKIMASLKRLAALPGDYRVCPGHEGLSTLETERRQNYYMRAAVEG